MKVYHNPKCSKSRQALEILDKNNIKYQVLEYLKEVPSVEELEALFLLLGMEMIRQKEVDFKPYKGLEKTANGWAVLLHENPKLIERPLLIKNSTEVLVARPTNKILEFI